MRKDMSMTNEQLNHYEALSTLVELAQDHVTDAAGQLIGMHLNDGESVEDYVNRVQDRIDSLNVQRMCLDEAKENKRAFVLSI